MLDDIKRRLATFTEQEIILTTHAQAQAMFRGGLIREVKENIINPRSLSYAIRQEARKAGEEKYDCYFGYSKTQCHRYILVLTEKCVVCTIIKIKEMASDC
ncbi:hypothetical protein D6774_03495 [Candidatus Woesearchaeota archaeon]|nr:MAG: hypothetical protein D6774_03495 [Candidatus Woesearchaeota archaeon]